MVEYKTVKFQTSDEFIERRSKFIGHIKPVKDEDDAISFINEIKSKHWDATHNVYAYSLRNGQIKRYSDDGEPQGTAGVPALEVLIKNNVTDVVVVITRYFGGIMLGAGGLVRAYSHAAKIALDAANIVTMQMCGVLELECDYSQYGKLSSTISDCLGTIDDSKFAENIKLTFHVPTDNINILNKRIADATCGKLCANVIREQFFSAN